MAGVAEGCVQAGCALVGGETAEHPGVMDPDDYDLAGFTVGVVDKSKILDNAKTAPGDVLLALPSSGVHSNGFSLVRRVFSLDERPEILDRHFDELGATLGEALLAPTRIYVKAVLALAEAVAVKGVSHITGGGFYENIPRSIPEGLAVRIEKTAVKTPPIFGLIQRTGDIPERDMFNTFNMGVGMTVTVAAADADRALALLRASGEEAYVLGTVVSGGERVQLV